MHIRDTSCDPVDGGVDLNRNYGYKWGQGNQDIATQECGGETYQGQSAFSEPETRAIRDFLTSHKNQVKFVYNFHCSGNMYIIPFNGELPNTLPEKFPEIA